MMEPIKQNGSASTGIVKYEAPSSANAYEPRTSTEAFEIAKHFAQSKLLSEMNPDAVFLVMAVGAELGIPATAALRGVYVVKNRPFVSADLMKSLCLRRRDVCEFFRLVKSDATQATYSAKRAGDEAVTMTFTMEQAKKAKLVKSDSAWEAYPETMLRHRCVAMLAREVFPDLVMGIYCIEEREEIEGETRVIEAQVIDRVATDDLEQRVAAFAKRIEDADSIATLKAIIPDVTADPAAIEIQARLNEQYSAKKKALES